MARKAATPPISEAQMDADTERVGNSLRGKDLVRIRISIDKQNESDKVVIVGVNGHVYRINRGEWVEVPQVVAELLEQGGYI